MFWFNQKEKEESSIKVGRLKGDELEALDPEEEPVSDEDEASLHIKQNIPKVVKFWWVLFFPCYHIIYSIWV